MKHVKPKARADNVLGSIERITASTISGWVASVEPNYLPLLFIGDRPAQLLQWPMPRGDVNRALGLPGDMGFQFSAEGLKPGDRIELYIFDGQSIRFVVATQAKIGGVTSNLISQVLQAKEISQNPDSVAITCWDGAHNPLGRAHVLYQAVTTQRPAVLVSYLFDEFGDTVWPPLDGSDFKRLIIPWEQRHEAFDLMAAVGVTFPTVWICKSRLPGFELAANLSDDTTRLVLDHDDNEAHFSRNSSNDRVYGPKSVSLARNLQGAISAHTAASGTLVEALDATMVRHARAAVETPVPRVKDPEVIKVGFIGTVRPHKGLIDAARAVRLASWSLKKKIELHVYGMFHPETLVEELEDLDVVTKGDVAARDLQAQLAEFDIVLTGFPTFSRQDSEITRYQISSKIGDALAAGRPVLVPNGDSVADLDDCPGVFLFERDTFVTALVAALEHEGAVDLPEAFSLDGAYKAFAEVEQKASTPPEQMAALRVTSPAVSGAAVPTLLLIWKQYDAGLYGRRVDQVARGYKDLFPDHRVIVLEFYSDHNETALHRNSGEQSHEARIIYPLLEKKARRAYTDRFGVEHHALRFPATAQFKAAFTSYLISERLLPENTKMVVFPVVPYLDHAYDILAEYPCVIDVVDNQFAWASDNTRLTYGGQYLSLLTLSDTIVLNSAQNLEFLKKSGFMTKGTASGQSTTLIPNWYMNGTKRKDRRKPGDVCHLVYSGNMNDRVDWSLMRDISDLDPNVIVHLIGSGARVSDRLDDLLERENIVYWGPMLEHQVSELLLGASAGLMPHVQDDVSVYMNPLKVQMYRAHGVPVISTDVPGINPDDVILCKSRPAFLKAVEAAITNGVSEDQSAKLISQTAKTARSAINRYVKVIKSLDPVSPDLEADVVAED